jgi:hypothetical protein
MEAIDRLSHIRHGDRASEVFGSTKSSLEFNRNHPCDHLLGHSQRGASNDGKS